MKKTLLALLALTVACSNDSTAPTQESVAGTWNLQSINGGSLPFTVSQTGTDKVEITGDQLTVTSTGSFTEITSVRTTTNGVATTQTSPDAGSFVLNGNNVTFQFQSDGSTGSGTVTGNTLTISETGLSLIYKKA